MTDAPERQYKILVVDDEPVIRQMLAKILPVAGPYEVVGAEGAEEALQKIGQSTFDLIFLDILMPKVEGHEALRKIRAACRTPVVILSGYLPEHGQKDILNAGAAACLEKPIEIEKVLAIVKNILKS
ncbi:MAG: response regulator [Candidatus Omnitrophota bacterium]